MFSQFQKSKTLDNIATFNGMIIQVHPSDLRSTPGRKWLPGAVLNVGNGWVAGAGMISSDEMDHSRKFPTFSTSMLQIITMIPCLYGVNGQTASTIDAVFFSFFAGEKHRAASVLLACWHATSVACRSRCHEFGENVISMSPSTVLALGRIHFTSWLADRWKKSPRDYPKNFDDLPSNFHG